MTKAKDKIYKLAESDAMINGFLEGFGLKPSPEMQLAEEMKKLADAQEKLAQAAEAKAK